MGELTPNEFDKIIILPVQPMLHCPMKMRLLAEEVQKTSVAIKSFKT
jgi:hypothetical protein